VGPKLKHIDHGGTAHPGPEGDAQEREFFGIDYRDHGLVFARPDGLPLRPDPVTV
jgi:integrase